MKNSKGCQLFEDCEFKQWVKKKNINVRVCLSK